MSTVDTSERFRQIAKVVSYAELVICAAAMSVLLFAFVTALRDADLGEFGWLIITILIVLEFVIPTLAIIFSCFVAFILFGATKTGRTISEQLQISTRWLQLSIKQLILTFIILLLWSFAGVHYIILIVILILVVVPKIVFVSIVHLYQKQLKNSFKSGACQA